MYKRKWGDDQADLDISFILEIHRTAFGELYSWAGKGRTIDVQVGKLSPPHPSQVPALMYQYADDVNYRLKWVEEKQADAGAPLPYLALPCTDILVP
ncbi:Fic family protein [Dyadobacter sp. CY261]|uniref:Fic family protein n=1 Tax=Dyadobacter sp. CY261 TaxID=2907203 RepID=UPI001F16A9E7|nr:Fic family protein [Dyadobacter sp. CY261]MCF0068875.1 Fic family protein [Dyadobacter sp. CY261]